jgi:hypothetical protein
MSVMQLLQGLAHESFGKYFVSECRVRQKFANQFGASLDR